MILAFAHRELTERLRSPRAWAVAAALLLLHGAFSLLVLDALLQVQGVSGSLGAFEDEPATDASAALLGTLAATDGVLLLLFVPLLTMGLCARDEQSGVLELLRSGPALAESLVVGKWLGLCAWLALLALPSAALLPLALGDGASLPTRHAASALTGLALLAGLTGALGLLASAWARSRTAAAGLSAALLLALWAAPALAEGDGLAAGLAGFVGLQPRFRAFADAVPRPADLAYFVLGTTWCLLAAAQSLRTRGLR